MATLDVSGIIDDPEFADEVIVVRRATIVDEFGLAQPSEEIYSSVIAVVTPASGESIDKLPEALRASGAMECFTRFRLMGPSEGGPGDEIQWQGETYFIGNLDRYLNFGEGFCHAVLIRKEIADNAQY